VVDTNIENLNINKLICEKKEMIFVEGDVIVPDSKPDIINTIVTSGNVCIYKKELLDEKIKIDGSVNTYIMYLADNSEDSVRGINVILDFTETLSVPECNESMMLNTDLKIKSIDCNVINGRKVHVKVGIEVKTKVYSNEEESIINSIQGTEDIQFLEDTLKVNSLVGYGNTKVYAKDTIMIDNADDLAEILKVNINMVDKDIKISYNKVLAKTEAEVKVMYLTEEGKIATVTNKIPVVGFIDIPNVTEENICDINYEIKNIIVKPNNVEEHSIYIEIEVGITCSVYEEKEINLIQDLYSTVSDITYEQKNVHTIANKINKREICYINEKINLPEIESNDLIDVEVTPSLNNENKLNSKIMYEGEVEIKFIFSEVNNLNVKSKSVIVPFEFIIDDVKNGEDINVNTILEVGNTDFVVQSKGEVRCSIDIIFNVSICKDVSINVINNINTQESRNMEDYSLIIYIVKSGDTLWQIAKRFRSTVDDIVRANGIENSELIHSGDKLYIPKYVMKKSSDNLKYA